MENVAQFMCSLQQDLCEVMELFFCDELFLWYLPFMCQVEVPVEHMKLIFGLHSGELNSIDCTVEKYTKLKQLGDVMTSARIAKTTVWAGLWFR